MEYKVIKIEKSLYDALISLKKRFQEEAYRTTGVVSKVSMSEVMNYLLKKEVKTE